MKKVYHRLLFSCIQPQLVLYYSQINVKTWKTHIQYIVNTGKFFDICLAWKYRSTISLYSSISSEAISQHHLKAHLGILRIEIILANFSNKSSMSIRDMYQRKHIQQNTKIDENSFLQSYNIPKCLRLKKKIK